MAMTVYSINLNKIWSAAKSFECLDSFIIKLTQRIMWSNSYHDLISQLSMLKPFKEEELYRYALFSAYSYCNVGEKLTFSRANRDLQDMPITGNFSVLLDTADYYIAQTPREVVIAFKGSTSGRDFGFSLDQTLDTMNDSFIFANYFNDNGSKCHEIYDDGIYYFRGFLQSIAKQQLDQISRLVTDRDTSRDVIVTGHSLGGVKAMITAFYLKKFHKVNPRVFTYSQPIMGSIKFNDYIAECIGVENITRVISESDFVPFVRRSKVINHATRVKVIYSYNHSLSAWKECLGPLNSTCGSVISCNDRNLDYHNWFSGLRIDDQVCEFR